MQGLLKLQSELMVKWLKDVAFPLWSTTGFNKATGLFHEVLDRKYASSNDTKRSMVQARQIFCTSLIVEMGAKDADALKALLASSTQRFVDVFGLGSGAFAFASDSKASPASDSDLYAQAFAIFALARSFAISHDAKLETRALAVLDYLERERTMPAGGYSEFEKGKAVLRSNPHMHLFEAALEWICVSKNPRWQEFSAKLFKIFESKILAGRPMVAEIFDAQWNPELNAQGAFFFEPGHHYEWAWLIARYAQATDKKHIQTSEKLFVIADQHGIAPIGETAVDQVWSDGQVKSNAARFWPQCERIKAASFLYRFGGGEKAAYARAASRAATNLMDYLHPLDSGLWSDSRDEHHAMVFGSSKASSLYHIAGAIAELHQLAEAL